MNNEYYYQLLTQNYDEAQKTGDQNTFAKCVELAETLEKSISDSNTCRKVQEILSVSYSQVVGKYLFHGNIDVAETYLDKVIAFNCRMLDTYLENNGIFAYNLALAYNNMGVLYDKKDNIKISENYYLKCFELCKIMTSAEQTVANYRILGGTCESLGDIKMKSNDVATAEDYYEKAVSLMVPVSNQTGTEFDLKDVARLYERLADCRLKIGQEEIAGKYMLMGIQFAEDVVRKNNTPQNIEFLANGYQKLGGIMYKYNKTGLNYWERSIELRDSLIQNGGSLDSLIKLAELCFVCGSDMCGSDKKKYDKDKLVKSFTIYEALSRKFPENKSFEDSQKNILNILNSFL